MLYPILKTIIDTTITQYLCQQCQGKVDENCISVGGTTDTQIHLDIICPHCQAHAHVHAEVANVQSQIIHTQSSTSPIPKNINALQDADIEAVEQNIHNAQSVEDLLN